MFYLDNADEFLSTSKIRLDNLEFIDRVSLVKKSYFENTESGQKKIWPVNPEFMDKVLSKGLNFEITKIPFMIENVYDRILALENLALENIPRNTYFFMNY